MTKMRSPNVDVGIWRTDRFRSVTTGVLVFTAAWFMLPTGCGTGMEDVAPPPSADEPPPPTSTDAKDQAGASPFKLIGQDAIFMDGNVGIGTDAPGCKLEVVGGLCTDLFRLSTAPANGFVLKSDANGSGIWSADGLSLPFAGSIADAGAALGISNTGDGGTAVFAIDNPGNGATALTATTEGVGHVAAFEARSALNADSALEVNNQGTKPTAMGIHASCGTSGLIGGARQGIIGESDVGIGIAGASNSGIGILGGSVGADGIFGVTLASGAAGVHGFVDQPIGNAILGEATGAGTAIHGTSAKGVAGILENLDANNAEPVLKLRHDGIGNGVNISLNNSTSIGRALSLRNYGHGAGVYAECDFGNAIWAVAKNLGTAAVYADNKLGESVVGLGGTLGTGAVVGRCDAVGGAGVRGFTTKDGSYGV